jgi:galactoside O-acetyltransferase
VSPPLPDDPGRDRAPGTNPGASRHSIRTVVIGTGATNASLDRWLDDLAAALNDPTVNRHDLVRDQLWQLYDGRAFDPAVLEDERLPLATRVRLEGLDPRNASLEPEYYYDCDPERYAPRKPLIWFWTMFDRSPLGRNLHVGFRLRRLLASHVFASVGRNVKIFQGLEVTFGYGLEVGDDVIIHREVLLDDRGGIRIGNRVSISDYANVYSHTHAVADIHDITSEPTVLGAGVRIAYHATLLSGVTIGADSMVGAHAVVTKDVPPHEVWGGVPAKPIGRKDRGKAT